MPVAELRAAGKQGYRLARIEQALRIEDTLDGVEHLQLGRGELDAPFK